MRTSRFWTPKPSQWPVISSRSIKFQVLSLWEWLFEVELTNCQESGSELFQAETCYRVCLYNSYSWPLSLCQAGCFVKSIKKLKCLCQTFPGQAKTANASILPGDGIASNIRHGWCFWKSSVKNIRSSYILIKDSVLCVWDIWLLGRYEGDGVAWFFGNHSVWMNNEWCALCSAVQSSAVWKDEIRNIAKGTIDPMVECSWQSYYLLI